MDTIHLDRKGLRVHLDFGRQPVAHHVPLRNRARAIHRHDLAFEAQLVRNTVVIGGTRDKADAGLGQGLAERAKHRAVDNRLRCRQRRVRIPHD